MLIESKDNIYSLYNHINFHDWKVAMISQMKRKMSNK